jgi:hypothetical protein
MQTQIVNRSNRREALVEKRRRRERTMKVSEKIDCAAEGFQKVYRFLKVIYIDGTDITLSKSCQRTYA